MSATPPTFAAATERNPFQQLLDLYNHAHRASPAATKADALAELALSAAVVSWWIRWQPITMHRVLLGGATLAELASATGLTEDEVHERWSHWTDVQCALDIGGRPALAPDTVADMRTRLHLTAVELP
ncbi:hypothetical protein [Dactylosporangium sp. NPDC051541]|uniref:hypothetical protein n=1 Tax=Dactylosporangium sp. NPDC051541 TaxID=3363977 RepID=UPI00379A2B02